MNPGIVPKFRIGADIGGTFTDVVVVEAVSRRVATLKVDTVVSSPDEGVDNAVAELLGAVGLQPEGCDWFAHGQTIALNALLTRRGARVGLVTTAGFGGLLEIGRARLPDPFDFRTQRTPPLIRGRLVREVVERIASGGEEVTPLDEAGLRRVVTELAETHAVQSIVVAFINAYRNQCHEERACELIRSWYPAIAAVGSAEVWPQAREYERTMVAVVNEYVGVELARYLRRLASRMTDRRIGTTLLVSTSNGGVTPAKAAEGRSVLTLLSGPAAGVVAAQYLREVTGLGSVITFDMGGTSADMAVLSEDDLPYTSERAIQGLPLAIPCIDVTSIGAGGGSIARVDSLGVLKVGPQSAGADPGPACYGRGGTEATVTDAYVAVGIIDPGAFLGGRSALDQTLALASVNGVAGTLGLSVEITAEGILRVATANLAREFTRLVAEKGIDAREFTLLAFGGAGPTHACFLANEMGVGRVAIPRAPGTFCALGALAADFRLDFVKTLYKSLDQVSVRDIDAWYEGVEQAGKVSLESSHAFVRDIVVLRSADVRFHLQGYDVKVPFSNPDDIDRLFRRRYYEIYGHLDEGTPVDLVNLEATVIGRVEKPPFETLREVDSGGSKQPAPEGQRRVYLNDRWQTIPVYARAKLLAGHVLSGPAVVSQDDTTCLITEGWSAAVDTVGTIVLEREG